MTNKSFESARIKTKKLSSMVDQRGLFLKLLLLLSSAVPPDGTHTDDAYRRVATTNFVRLKMLQRATDSSSPALID